MKSSSTLAELINKAECEARLVYVLQEAGEPNVKVGITKDFRTLKVRQANLQTGNPRRLLVARLWRFTQDLEAYHMEQAILDRFRGHRIEGSEWLRLVGPGDVQDYVRNKSRFEPEIVQLSQLPTNIAVLPRGPIS